MIMIKQLRKKFLDARVQKLADIFNLDGLSVLDLGGYDGRYMDALKIKFPSLKVTIADYDEKGLAISRQKGYNTIQLDGSRKIPFADKEFDFVFCNSVIEHVTIPKNEVWQLDSSAEFKKKSLLVQQHFASEIERIGKSYFVQTPNRYFFIEHHSWLPFVQFIPRKQQIKFLQFTNKFWVKKTAPDWNLLTVQQLSALFPKGNILKEKLLFMNKSIIAYKKHQ